MWTYRCTVSPHQGGNSSTTTTERSTSGVFCYGHETGYVEMPASHDPLFLERMAHSNDLSDALSRSRKVPVFRHGLRSESPQQFIYVLHVVATSLAGVLYYSTV